MLHKILVRLVLIICDCLQCKLFNRNYGQTSLKRGPWAVLCIIHELELTTKPKFRVLSFHRRRSSSRLIFKSRTIDITMDANFTEALREK